MFEVSVEQEFSSAHALRDYNGACENVHGHNFRVQVVIEGETVPPSGMLIDFLKVKAMMDAIVARLDHKFLNDLPPFDVKNPTSENIAQHFCETMSKEIAGSAARVKEVTVWETAHQSAIYRP